MTMNQRIVLASRPDGAVRPENFRLESVPLSPLEDGQLRVRNHFLSLDPYMRGAMNEGILSGCPGNRRHHGGWHCR